MKFRVWHLLAVMAFMAVWLPVSKWLLALEAKDHPTIPQTTADFVGFYLGSIVPVALLFGAVFWIVQRKRTSAAKPNSLRRRDNEADA